ncbi:hypothetical protein SEUCBS139899_000379 [Sporothrix eucalyptigena]|uniref:Myb-like DNA-binding domain-containing protein n=1 Tax=Sporothrix eucalyptigena TaxID=1812306 RepID=A0ABP0BDB3_9PEZI
MPSVNLGQSNGESAGGGNGTNTAINPDKAIARLLYAMLKQKSLKDIDWNQVACDPALLEEISNGHAARMRYSRFRTAVENQTKTTGSEKDSSTHRKTKAKAKVAKARRDAPAGKRSRDKDVDSDEADINTTIKADAATEDPDNEDNGPNLDLDLNFDGAGPDITNKADKALEDLTNTSFSSSLPSPPTESMPTMAESLALLERKKKMRKMYTFSPTMKAQTLHQIPLPRSSMSQASVGAMRVHSLPTLPNATSASPSTATTPVNLSDALMMRHHSAGSLAPELNPHQQQHIMRQARMMTPTSDIDHQTYHSQHHHTQLSLPADSSVGLDATFDFTFGNNTTVNANNSCNNHGSSTTGHPSPWMATPFSSPPVPTFDMSPYATTLDMMGGGVGNMDPESQSMPGLFQTQLDVQQQQRASFMAHAFAKHGSWDAMLGQGSTNNSSHSHHSI